MLKFSILLNNVYINNQFIIIFKMSLYIHNMGRSLTVVAVKLAKT